MPFTSHLIFDGVVAVPVVAVALAVVALALATGALAALALATFFGSVFSTTGSMFPEAIWMLLKVSTRCFITSSLFTPKDSA